MLSFHLPKVQEAHLPGAFPRPAVGCEQTSPDLGVFILARAFAPPLPPPSSLLPPSPVPEEVAAAFLSSSTPSLLGPFRPRQSRRVPREGVGRGRAGELRVPPRQPLLPRPASVAALTGAALLQSGLGLTPQVWETQTRHKLAK